MSSENFTISKKALITLIAASIVVIISLGIRQTFGLFYFDFNADLDISISHFGFVMGLQLLLWGVFSPLFGVITDKYGGAVAIFIGFVFYLIGVLFFYSGFNSGGYFTLTIGVMIGIGLGSTAIGIPVSVVAKHFPASNRTIATGIVTCAGSFGYFVSPLLVRYSLVETGWENTLLYFCLLLGVGLVVSLFVSTPKIPVGVNQDNNQTAREALKEAFANKSFIYLTLGFFVCGWHIALVATHIPTYMADKGLPDWTPAMVLALIGVFNMAGTITSGYLATRYSKKKILSAIYLLRGVSIIYFIFLPPSIFNSVVFGVTFGFLWLSTVPPTNGIVAHIFGTKYVGLLYGIVFVSHQIGSFLGAYLGGVFYELNGNFDYAWYGSIALSIFAGLIHLPIVEKAIERTQPA
ncbi:MFS transporter [Candidatus Pelagibacter sp. FZCC0015]|uniref:MFS transporter n=1 Tax=Candidatus Pelagibacter sp. FZCC0015 TaxID=2268451 RepID=UPI0011A12066|nr:MFS transporter [Candidatus Pelagibacter sp. FZCC0015]